MRCDVQLKSNSHLYTVTVNRSDHNEPPVETKKRFPIDYTFSENWLTF